MFKNTNYVDINKNRLIYRCIMKCVFLKIKNVHEDLNQQALHKVYSNSHNFWENMPVSVDEVMIQISLFYFRAQQRNTLSQNCDHYSFPPNYYINKQPSLTWLCFQKHYTVPSAAILLIWSL